MNIVPKKKEDRLTFFEALFRDSEKRRDKAFGEIPMWRAQYEGSKEIDGSGVKAKVVRNVTYEALESQVSTEIPAARVDARVWSERNDRCAKNIERLCNNVRNALPFERLNDEDERLTLIEGGSVWFSEWDDSLRSHNECGGVRISCMSAEDMIPQPGIYVVEDMDYLFLRFQSTKEEIQDKYGVTPAAAENAENTADVEEPTEDTCTVIVCFYRNENGFVSQFIWSGSTVLVDLDDYYARKRYVCSRCGRRRELCASYDKCDCGADFEPENEEYEELTRDIMLDDGTVIPAHSPKYNENGTPVTRKSTRIRQGVDGAPLMQDVGGVMVPFTDEYDEQVMEPTRLPWYRPKTFPVVVRKNIARRNSVLGQSDCKPIRDQQQEINKIETRIHEKITSAGCYPYKPEEVRFEYDDTIGQYVLNIPNGHTRMEFGVLDMMPQLAGEQLQSDRYYEHAKKTLGITASFQGQEDTTAKSGVAKQTQVAQAAGRLASKRVMKNAAYADLDKILFELHLAYADEPRPLAFKDAFGRVQNSAFNRYDYLRYDEDTHEWYYEDRFMFSADKNGAMDTQREVLWQMNLQNFQAGVYGDPAQPATLLRYWQMQEMAHYPYARENVEYFTALVSAGQQAVAQQQGGMSNV